MWRQKCRRSDSVSPALYRFRSQSCRNCRHSVVRSRQDSAVWMNWTGIVVVDICTWTETAWLPEAKLLAEPDTGSYHVPSSRFRLRVCTKCFRAPMSRHRRNIVALPGKSQFGSRSSRAYALFCSTIFRYRYSVAMLFQSFETKQSAFKSE